MLKQFIHREIKEFTEEVFKEFNQPAAARSARVLRDCQIRPWLSHRKCSDCSTQEVRQW
jgi:hypothetical protein